MNLSAYSAVPASLCGPTKPMSTKRIPQYSLSRAYCRKILASTAISRSALRRLASKCRRMILLMNAEVSCTQWSATAVRSEEHTSELQSLAYLVCRLLLEKKKKKQHRNARCIHDIHSVYMMLA